MSIKTLPFLPLIFQTPTNQKFLNATLDQLVAQPDFKKVNGYIGRKFAPTYKSTDNYVTEGSSDRQNYQLEPSVISVDSTDNVTFFSTYTDLIQQIQFYGGLTKNHSRLFSQDSYSFDGQIDFDKFVNFNQYYWLPSGPAEVNVFSNTIPNFQAFAVTRDVSIDAFTIAGYSTPNPEIILARGGTYQFNVSQPGFKFWIQADQGIDGQRIVQPNINTRQVLGVVNNGIDSGTITFTVPQADAQDGYVTMPLVQSVDFATNLKFTDINAQLVTNVANRFGGIDGVATNLQGKFLIFTNNDTLANNWIAHDPYAIGNYSISPYDLGPNTDAQNTRTGIWQIHVTNTNGNEVITLLPYRLIPVGQKVFVKQGNTQANFEYYKTSNNQLQPVPLITAPLDKIFYSDESNPLFYGTIRIVDPLTFSINVDDEIVGKLGYTSPNGVTLTNGLKIKFNQLVYPLSYANKTYYVEGVGRAIKLVDANTLITPESNKFASSIPFDIYAFDANGYDTVAGVDVADYTTINRSSIDANPWSRANRWFHSDIITLTAQYNKTVPMFDQLHRAAHPIIEFKENLQLFNNGRVSLPGISVIDFTLTDPLANLQNQQLTSITASQLIVGHTYQIDSVGTTDFTLVGALTNTPGSSFVATATGTGTGIVTDQLLKTFNDTETIIFAGATDSIVRNKVYTYSVISQPATSYSVPGTGAPVSATTIVAGQSYTIATLGDTNFVALGADAATLSIGSTFIATGTGTGTGTVVLNTLVSTPATLFADLIEVPGITVQPYSTVIPSVGTIVNLLPIDTSLFTFNPTYRHINLADGLGNIPLDGVLSSNSGLITGYSYWFDGAKWIKAQSKLDSITVPIFDIVDSNNMSFNDSTTYPVSTFEGCKLFSYLPGTGAVNAEIGVPFSYRNINNVGDLEFANNYDTESFTYLVNLKTIAEKVNNGFIAEIVDRNTIRKLNIWNKKSEASKQYQILPYVADGTATDYFIDILPDASVHVPNLKVFVNSKRLLPTQFSIVSSGVKNYIRLATAPAKNDQIDIVIYSATQVSAVGYYEIPNNLDMNALNANFTSLTHGQFRNHLSKIASNTNNIVGLVPGSSNLRDVDAKQFGGAILQHSAPLIYSELFLLNKNVNFIDANNYAMKEYARFKNRFLESYTLVINNGITDVAAGVDAILHQLNIVKNNQSPWYYSDMVPYDQNKNVITYTVFDLANTSYEIDTIFNDSILSNKAIIVYVNGVQLVKGVDYSFSQTSPSINFTYTLNYNDTIAIHVYSNTDGCYIPETPTKLGIYPKFIPKVYVDTSYATPVTVLRGHDGSITPIFGDMRDDLLLELEKRIYNNIKIAYNTKRFDINKFLPGKFRATDYTREEFNTILSQRFMQWINNNRTDYITNQWFNSNNNFSWTYSSFKDIINGEYLPGYWRGVYKYFYDTDAPHLRPWECLGFTDQPDWWVSEYGPAPYTSGNTVLWNDLELGFIKLGDRAGTYAEYARPGLSKVIPITDGGVLKAPDDFLVTAFNGSDIAGAFVLGDEGPVETAWRRSSDYPFAVQQALALMKPAMYFGQLINMADYRNDNELDQFIQVDTNQRLTLQGVELNGELITALTETKYYPAGTTIRNAGYMNWIVDYVTGYGSDAITTIHSYLDSLQVRLGYRVGGYTDKPYLTILADQVNPSNNTTKSVVIPKDNYKVHIHKSTPVDRLVYSAVIIEKTTQGYTVSGYSTEQPYFTIIPSEPNNNRYVISAAGADGIIYNNAQSFTMDIPYGHEFMNKQQVVDFLVSYSRQLTSRGFQFTDVDAEMQVTRDWMLSIREFLTWSQQGWAPGNILVASPTFHTITVTSPGSVIDEITNLPMGSKVLDVGFNVIKSDSFTISRTDNNFSLSAIKDIAIGLVDLSLVQYENALIFDNVTVFNDVIYKPEIGNRQYRLKLVGSVTNNWTGQFAPVGFIYSNPSIPQWATGKDYRKGEIVKYNGFMYTAIVDTLASDTFTYTTWSQIDSSAFKTGMLPNLSYNASKFENMYNVDNQVADQNINEFAMGLIGYRNRPYLTELRVDPTSQVKFYQGFIKEKGTVNAISALASAQFENLGGNLSFNEEWAFRVGNYGATQSNQEIEVQLVDSVYKYNPIAMSLQNVGEAVTDTGVINLYPSTLYKSPVSYTSGIIKNRDLSSDLSNDIHTAGYVHLNDIDATIFDITDTAALNALIPNLVAGYKIWVAKDTKRDWNVYRLTENTMQIVEISYQLNKYAQFTTSAPHLMNTGDMFAVRDFAAGVDGFYTVLRVDSPTTIFVAISTALDAQLIATPLITGAGFMFGLHSVRVLNTSDLTKFTPNAGWVTNDRIWVDQHNTNNEWAVLQKNDPWVYNSVLPLNPQQLLANNLHGSAIASSTDGKLVAVGAPGVRNGVVTTFVNTASPTYYPAAQLELRDTPNLRAPMVVDINYINLSPATQSYSVTFTIDPTMVVSVSNISNENVPYTLTLDYTIDYLTNSIVFTAPITSYDQIRVTQSVPAQYGHAIDTAQGHLVISAPGTYNNAGRVEVYTTLPGGESKLTQIITSGNMTTTAPFFALDSTQPFTTGSRFGSSLSLSADAKWLYVGADGKNAVYAFALQDAAIVTDTIQTQVEVTTYDLPLSIAAVAATMIDPTAGILVTSPTNTLVPGIDYNIDPVRMTIDFRGGAGFFGITPVYTLSTAPYYLIVDIIDNPFGGSPDENFGVQVKTQANGEYVVVSSDNSSSNGIIGEGQVHVFNRAVQHFIGDGVTTIFTLASAPNIYVSNITINGNVIPTTDYNIAASDIVFVIAPAVNDKIVVNINNFSLQQTLNQGDLGLPYNAHFGAAITMSANNDEIFVSATGYNDLRYKGGQVYRFSNSATSFGEVISAFPIDYLVSGDIVINNVLFTFTGQTLAEVITIINAKGIVGLTASDANGYLKLTYRSTTPLDKMTVVDIDFTLEMASQYVQTQLIRHPYPLQSEFFASTIGYDDVNGTLVASGVGANTVTKTGIDAGATTFDYRTTGFVDTVNNTGAVYVFEELFNPVNSITTPSAFSYVQALSIGQIAQGVNFGSAISMSNGAIFVGANKTTVSNLTNAGQAYFFSNLNNRAAWEVTRVQAPKVDIKYLDRVFMYNKASQNILTSLDHLDPVKGKILGLADEEINFKTSFDPARYNTGTNANISIVPLMSWGASQVGQIWWNLDAVRFLDYEQDSLTYRIQNWGKVFPGSQIEINEWVESTVLPSQYTGDGTVVYPDDSAYTVTTTVDTVSGIVLTKYYFWVKNKTQLTSSPSRRLPASAIADMIANPDKQNIPYINVLQDNSFALISANQFLSADTTILQIGYSLLNNENIIHNEYELIQDNSSTANIPAKLVSKLIDSLTGADAAGNSVPDIKLLASEKYGISLRPRQTMFVNKQIAVKNFVENVNALFKTTPIATQFNIAGLYAADPVPTQSLVASDSMWFDPAGKFLILDTQLELTYLDSALLTSGQTILVLQDTTHNNGWTLYQVNANKTFSTYRSQTYQTTDYWVNENWYSADFDPTSKITYTIATLADMAALTLAVGNTIKVNNSGNGLFVIYKVNADLTTSVVGIQNGTIQLSPALWDYASYSVGFDNDRFDIVTFDINPVKEFRNIINTLLNDVFINTLAGKFNELFFMLLNYIMSEQKLVDWAFKTSFVSVIHKLRKLEQYPNYVQDNQTYYEEYIKEVKPYRTTVREYVLNYEGIDAANMHTSDFDIQPYYDAVTGKWVSPDATTISSDARYTDWAANNTYSIGSVNIAAPGNHYIYPPTLVVQGGGGTGAKLVAEVDTTFGKVTRVTVLDPGQGYTSTPQIIVIGGGVDATGAQTCRLYPVMQNTKIRSFNTSMKFDRISYTSGVKQWAVATYYTPADVVSRDAKAYTVNSISSINSGSVFTAEQYTIVPNEYKINVSAGNLIPGTQYVIESFGTTDFVAANAASQTIGISFIATNNGAADIVTHDGSFVNGAQYVIKTLGNTDFTAHINASPVNTVTNVVGTVFTANIASAGVGTGTGTATLVEPASAITDTTSYMIISAGTTDFTLYGAASNKIGTVFTANVKAGVTVPGTGTVTIAGVVGTVSTSVDINAGYFVPTQSYMIVSAGTTDFVLAGAVNSTPGTIFTANAVGTGTGISRQVISANNMIAGKLYEIVSHNTTSIASAGSFVSGTTYVINIVGDTNFTLVGAADNNVGTTFIATSAGSGSGSAIIVSTDFTQVGASSNTVGTRFVATGAALGSGTVVIPTLQQWTAGTQYTAGDAVFHNNEAYIVSPKLYSGAVFDLGQYTLIPDTQLASAADRTMALYAPGTGMLPKDLTALFSGTEYPGNQIDGSNFTHTTVTPLVGYTPATALIPGNAYKIVSTGTTDFTLVGAPNNNVGTVFMATTANIIKATQMVAGVRYSIVFLGTTDFTQAGAPQNAAKVTFIATGPAIGTGIVSADIQAGNFIAGAKYEITTVNNTDFTLIGSTSNAVGTIFTATGIGAGTSLITPSVASGNLVVGDMYTITNLGNTDFKLLGAPDNKVGLSFIATNIGAGTSLTSPVIATGNFVPGQLYTIKTLGNTDFKLIGAASNTVGLSFVATAIGSGLGSPSSTMLASNMVAGATYTIRKIISTDFTLVGAPTNAVGLSFVATGPATGEGTVTPGSGNGTAYQGSGTGTVATGSGNGTAIPADGVGSGTGTASRVVEYTVDNNGITLELDSTIQSSFVDSALGTRPEDINIVGGSFVDSFSSHAPEELVPGMMYDTLDIKVFTVGGLSGTATAANVNPIGFRISKTMLDETKTTDAWEFKRICADNTTKLVQDLAYNDTAIFVENVALLPEPSEKLGIPGVIYVNSEKITYYAIDRGTNSITRLRRGVWGTGTPALHRIGSFVSDASIAQTIPGATLTSTWLNMVGANTDSTGIAGSTSEQALFLKACASYLPWLPNTNGIFVDPNASNTRFDDSGAGQLPFPVVHPFDTDPFDSYIVG